jgi:toxin ParE1/3/4
MGKVERRPEVRRDLLGNAEYISQHNLDAAWRFLEAAESTFAFLSDSRGFGEVCRFSSDRLADLRMTRVEGFPNHLVFFRPTDAGVEIVRVLHGARDIETLFGE